jgi:rhodanese-related sulfurtransferase
VGAGTLRADFCEEEQFVALAGSSRQTSRKIYCKRRNGGVELRSFIGVILAAVRQRGGISMKHSPQFLKLVGEAKRRVKETNVADVKKRMDGGEKFLLVDVREDNEWANGHLPGAVHMGRGIIERDIETKVPETSTKIILYCGGGFRSALVADNLQKMGYTNVESMDGGWRGWTEAGLPTAKD